MEVIINRFSDSLSLLETCVTPYTKMNAPPPSFSGKKIQNDRKRTQGGVAFQRNLDSLEFLEF